MTDSRTQLVAAWWAKAEEDLAVASLLIRDEKRLLSAGVYHCQQAAEKALKAWLTAQGKVFPKTHDLEVLLHLASASDESMRAVLSIAARELTPLATVFRYPGDMEIPSEAEALASFDQAERVVHHMRDSLRGSGFSLPT